MEENFWKNMVVIGAGGKMGRGIALLLLQTLTAIEAEACGKVGTGQYKLFLIELDEERHPPLKCYLKEQMRRYAEKEINKLRRWFSKNELLVSNGDMITAYVEGAMEILHFAVKGDFPLQEGLVFEVIAEDADVKIDLFKDLKNRWGSSVYYLTNTSSIPIHVLDEQAGLEGKIIGFHFYHPPPVQKVVEVVLPKKVDSHLVAIADHLGRQLGKILVPSNDMAGFIGNGHMIREIRYACELMNMFEGTSAENVWLVDTISRDYLLRPMGIFQLVDFVGIDICVDIAKTMEKFLYGETFLPLLMKKIVQQGVLGGQDGQGKQRDGFFAYEQEKIVGVYDSDIAAYIPLTDESIDKIKRQLGEKPEGWLSWKQLQRHPQRQQMIMLYFDHLYAQKGIAAEMAIDMMKNSKNIMGDLVTSGVALRLEDVKQVLKDGFHHLYTPDEVIKP